jgi:DNA-binding SARP family transcriptional activator
MTDHVRVRLLGRFEVEIGERTVTDGSFERKQAASLVKILALSGGRRLHREQVIDALWPEATVDEAAPRLHKAASYARTALGDKQAVVLRDEAVLLWPDAEPAIDVAQFELAADLAQSGSVDEAAAAADLYGGELLPGDPYEDWAGESRTQLHLRYLDVLRTAGRWEALLEAEPADEEAHVTLMRRFVADGQRLSTLRQFERLERALNEELGVTPGEEALGLRSQVITDNPTHVELIDRTNERGNGSLILLTGTSGIGKTALCEWLIQRAEQSGFGAGRSVAASIDGPWPYAPVLDAIDDLLRQRPDLLDELPDTHRSELMRVREAPGSAHDGFGDDDGHQRLFVAVDELIRLGPDAGGVVLFIDDLHAADDASLALLHYVGRQVGRQRLLLVGTARSSADAEAMTALRGLVGRRGAREIPLGPFGSDHSIELIRALTDDDPSDDTIEQILTLSGGTPFYVEELAKSMRSGPGGPLPDHLPPSSRPPCPIWLPKCGTRWPGWPSPAPDSTPISSSRSVGRTRSRRSICWTVRWTARSSNTPPGATSSATA